MNLTNMQTVRTLLEQHGFHFSKKLGQNFLINPSVCPRIAEMGFAAPGYGVLEIGTGVGTLTQELAKRAEKVVAVEIDQRLIPIVKETVGDYSNLTVLNQDILKCDFNQLIQTYFSGLNVVVCANLPYYITAPILMYLLESNAPIQAITVMVQREVADKLTAAVGTREASALTVAVQYYGAVKRLFSVSRGSFLPAPNVDSAVIQIQLDPSNYEKVFDHEKFFSIVKSGFSQRRKTMVNALSSGLFIPKEQIIQCLESLNIQSSVRIEQLTMEQLIAFSNHLNL